MVERAQALASLYQSSNMVGRSSKVAIYRNLGVGKSFDVLRKALGIDENELKYR